MPLPVLITESKPREGIEKVLKCTPLRIPTGPSVGVRVGSCEKMAVPKLAENCQKVG